MAVFTRDYSKLYVISGLTEEARDETITKLGVEDVTKKIHSIVMRFCLQSVGLSCYMRP